MKTLTEELANELANLEVMSKDESTILTTFGNFIFDLVAKVNLGGDNSITNIYYPEELTSIMNKLKEKPFLPAWVLEKFEGEDPDKVLQDFSNLIQNEIIFSAAPIENFQNGENDVKKWILFDSTKAKQERFLLNFADTLGVRAYIAEKAPDLKVDFTDLKSMYLQFAMMECISNTMMEQQNQLTENRSGVGVLS